MALSYRINDKEASISIGGHFNFSLHGAFRDACNAILGTSGVQSIEINLMDADYLDSSALGMLLVLKEQANNKGIQRLMIVNAKPTIKQILTIAKFEKFFQVD